MTSVVIDGRGRPVAAFPTIQQGHMHLETLKRYELSIAGDDLKAIEDCVMFYSSWKVRTALGEFDWRANEDD